MDFNALKKNLKKDSASFQAIKIALLADSASQLLVQALKGMGIENALNLIVFEAEFDQIDMQIMDSGSELYRFDPEIIIIFKSTHQLLQKYNKEVVLQRRDFAQKTLDHIQQSVLALKNKTNARIIFCNFTEEDDRVFGQYANKTDESFLYQLRHLNVSLQVLAAQTGNLFICDLSTIQNTIGRNSFWSPSIFINTEMTISLDALPLVAHSMVQIILALRGAFKKCLILDLDNTVWGGIIGDDGIDNIQVGPLGIGKAFTEFQYWIAKLQQRGIIIAVCSKNTEATAKEPFEKHPDMVLRLADIAVFVANWENKVDNIRKIQKILNIGFDSMVFLDDNPFERNMVRESIAEITVPELPEDPALYLDFLYGLNLFETASCSREDTDRTRQYQQEAQRNLAAESFTNTTDFLKSLNMISEAKSFDAYSIPRVAQLSQRSNQFNLRTVRYTEEDIARISASGLFITISFTLEDKYGDHGLICAVIMEKKSDKTVFIDTWIMSCRVLGRGMEQHVLNRMVSLARESGVETLTGEYLPTAKNDLVKDHFQRMGFAWEHGVWKLDIASYQTKENYISIK